MSAHGSSTMTDQSSPDPVLTGDDHTPAKLSYFLLDRSQARLRVSQEKFEQILNLIEDLEHNQIDLKQISETDQDLLVQLEQAGIVSDDGFDPMAAMILQVVKQASCKITVDLRYGPDFATRTVWATTREAVISGPAGDGFQELFNADVAQLPVLIGQLILLRSPKHIDDAPISIATNLLSIKTTTDSTADNEQAIELLMEGGLLKSQAQRVLRFQGDRVRRWRINSIWSTSDGQDQSELRGIDADDEGQWLVATTGSKDEPGQITFTPQGHGELMRALRTVLPKMWYARPLDRAPIESL